VFDAFMHHRVHGMFEIYVRVECKPNGVRVNADEGLSWIEHNFVSIQRRYISHESQFEPTIGCHSSTNKKNYVTLEQHCHFVKPGIKFSSNTISRLNLDEIKCYTSYEITIYCSWGRRK